MDMVDLDMVAIVVSILKNCEIFYVVPVMTRKIAGRRLVCNGVDVVPENIIF